MSELIGKELGLYRVVEQIGYGPAERRDGTL